MCCLGIAQINCTLCVISSSSTYCDPLGWSGKWTCCSLWY